MLQVLVILVIFGKSAKVINARNIVMLDGKIVGGKETTIEEYPYQLSLENNGKHTCGASLIKYGVAITAAHCTYKRSPQHFQIRAGSTLCGSGGETASITNIYQHPKYLPSTIDYDISVLILNQSFTPSTKIKTIDLQPEGSDIPSGTLANVTGWGTLKSGGSLTTKLQVVEVPRVSHDDCSASYRKEKITERMICFGFTEGGKDSCQGDSGGPLVVDGKQVGIVSWGYGCARPKLPGVYSKISNKEINEHIQNCIAKSEQ